MRVFVTASGTMGTPTAPTSTTRKKRPKHLRRAVELAGQVARLENRLKKLERELEPHRDLLGFEVRSTVGDDFNADPDRPIEVRSTLGPKGDPDRPLEVRSTVGDDGGPVKIRSTITGNDTGEI